MNDNDIDPNNSDADSPDTPLHERGLAEFKRQQDAWSEQMEEMRLDIQCVTDPLGPWPESERKERMNPTNPRPILHEDILTQYVHQLVNQGEMNPISFDIQSGDDLATIQGKPDPGQDKADQLENRLRAMDYESNAEDARLAGLRNAALCGIGVWFLETEDSGGDGFDDDICTRAEMDSLSVLLDSDSMEPDWSDQNNVFKVWTMTKKAAKQRYGEKIDLKSIDLFREKAPDWFPSDKLQFAIWWRREPIQSERVLVDDGTDTGLPMDSDELPKDSDAKVTARRKKTKYRVFKTVMSGASILENIEWSDSGEADSQIPCLVTTGPVKYMEGKRVIESLVRKGRIGQLQYDGCISTMWEVVGLTPKPHYAGGEGQFNTSTDFKTIHRNPIGYAEFKLIDERTGTALEIPRLDTYEPPLQALELLKQSIMVGIQNAIGMQSTERKDRTAKSGKALEKLDETANVATFHYFKSWRMAVEREGRLKVRLLQKLERTPRMVSMRDPKGDQKPLQLTQDHWKGNFTLVVSVGPSYQSQREADSELADTLLSTHPEVFPYVAPSAIMLKGDTPYHRELRDVLIAAAPPAVQAVLKGEQAPDPRALQAIAQAKQMMAEMQGELQKLQFEKQARMVETSANERMHADDNKTKLLIAMTNASVKEDVASLEALFEKATSQLDRQYQMLDGALSRQHEMTMAQSDQAHQRELAASGQAQDAGMQASDQAHEANMTAMGQAHESNMQDNQLTADQQAAEAAAANSQTE